MPAKKRSAETQAEQSARFLQAARVAEVDEGGGKFARALKKIVTPKRRARTKKAAK